MRSVSQIKDNKELGAGVAHELLHTVKVARNWMTAQRIHIDSPYKDSKTLHNGELDLTKYQPQYSLADHRGAREWGFGHLAGTNTAWKHNESLSQNILWNK